MISRSEIELVVICKYYDGPITGICKYKEGYYFYSQVHSNDAWMPLDPTKKRFDIDEEDSFCMPRIYGLYKMETDILAHHLYWYFSKSVNSNWGRKSDLVKPNEELYKVKGIQQTYYDKFFENHFKKDKKFDLNEYQEKREDLIGFFMH
jgi:hypothetical protein